MKTIILKIESGVVSEVYASSPVKVVVVDHDVIEGGETFEQRVKKSVSTMEPDRHFSPEDKEALIISLVLDCVRPADRGPRRVREQAGRSANSSRRAAAETVMET